MVGLSGCILRLGTYTDGCQMAVYLYRRMLGVYIHVCACVYQRKSKYSTVYFNVDVHCLVLVVDDDDDSGDDDDEEEDDNDDDNNYHSYD